MGVQGEFFERREVPIAESREEVSTIVPSDASNIRTPVSRRIMKDLSIPKLYYSISEVSRLTGLEPYVLRYWETEFDELSPQKNRAGNRIYSNREIKFILRIKDLLREKRYTIEGAKHILKADHGVEAKEQTEAENDPAQIPLAPEKVAAPAATITMEEIRGLKESLTTLKSLLMK